MIFDDISAWNKFPHHRLWFNKLWLSEQFGYTCGPGGVAVPKEDTYIVRPIYNLRGMGAGAEILTIHPNNIELVPPGYFWCEVFYGDHYSIEYKWENNNWQMISAFQGINSKENLYKFQKWIRKSIEYQPPNILDVLQDCEYINLEIIDNKIIEVHLRRSPDPNYNEIIPVWEGEDIQTPQGYQWIQSADDADGFIKEKRLGFFVK